MNYILTGRFIVSKFEQTSYVVCPLLEAREASILHSFHPSHSLSKFRAVTPVGYSQSKDAVFLIKFRWFQHYILKKALGFVLGYEIPWNLWL